MRLTPLVLAASFVAYSAAAYAEPRPGDELARARALDQQGAKAYAEGRYNDAIRYFEEAHRVGGPPFELWNIARCHARLDQPEQAAEVLERYLALSNVPADDREEASRELDQLRKRPSTLTVSSSPTGASVLVDGKLVEGAKTPLSTSIAPGAHTVTIALSENVSYTQQVDARFGRAVILDAKLSPGEQAVVPSPPLPPPDDARVALRGFVGAVFPRYGAVGGATEAGGVLSGTYRFTLPRPVSFGAGVLVFMTGETWSNTTSASTAAAGCPRASTPYGATALSAFATGTLGWQVVPRLSAGAVGGLGVATFATDEVGGDLFEPSCRPSPGVRPAALAGAEIAYALTRAVRATAMPILVELHPAFGGARAIPLDTTGLWMRTLVAIGLGVDL